MDSPHLIVLNGTSSSGKSSIARAILRSSEVKYQHLEADDYFKSQPDDLDDYEVVTELMSKLYSDAISNLERGVSCILDVVLQEESDLQCLLSHLRGTPTYLIGIHCPLKELERRETARDNRNNGTASYQFDRVHRHDLYDLELITEEQTPEACGDKILECIATQKPIALAKVLANPLYQDRNQDLSP